MTTPQSNADQVAYWNGDAGQKWTRSQERLDAMLSGISAELLAAAHITPKDRILDIGCGCGDTSIAMAGLGASVTGVDISAPMLTHARHRASGVTFVEADAANHQFDRDFSLLFSRFGVMFFARPDDAFANMRKALLPDGRVAFACWRDWRENEWVRVPLSAVRPLVPPQPQMGPEDPGPFAFADLARVRRILANAGFDRITARPFDCPMRLGDTLNEALAHLLDIGPVSRLLAEATPEVKQKANSALKQALSPYESQQPVTMGGAVWIVTAVSP